MRGPPNRPHMQAIGQAPPPIQAGQAEGPGHVRTALRGHEQADPPNLHTPGQAGPPASRPTRARGIYGASVASHAQARPPRASVASHAQARPPRAGPSVPGPAIWPGRHPPTSFTVFCLDNGPTLRLGPSLPATKARPRPATGSHYPGPWPGVCSPDPPDRVRARDQGKGSPAHQGRHNRPQADPPVRHAHLGHAHLGHAHLGHMRRPGDWAGQAVGMARHPPSKTSPGAPREGGTVAGRERVSDSGTANSVFSLSGISVIR